MRAAANADPTPGSIPSVSAVGSIGTGGPVSFLTLGSVAHNAQSTAIAIFQALFGIELVYAGGMWALQTQGSSKLLIDYVIKIVQGMAMVVLIQNAPTALTFVVNSARCLALEASVPNASFSGMCSSGAGLMGTSIATTPAVGTTYAGGSSITLPPDLTNGLDPGSLLHFGVTTAFGDLMSANISMSTGGSSIQSAVLTAAAAATGIGTVLLIVAATAVSVAFLLLAMELLGVTIEAALIGNVGIVMLGFLGSRWTIRYGQNYISYGLSVAARIFIIYMLCGLGEVFFFNEEQTSKAGGWTIPSLFMVVATAFLFVFLVKRVDKMTAAIFSGQSSFSGLHDVALPAAETTLTAAAIGAAAVGGTAMVAGKMGSVSAGSRLAALSGGAGGASETISTPPVPVPPSAASTATRGEGTSSYVPFPGGAAQPPTRAITPPAETEDAASTNAAPPDYSAAPSTPSSPSPSESYETPLAAEGAANRSERLRQLRAGATAQDADHSEPPAPAVEGEYQPAAAAPQPAPPPMQPQRSMQPTAANRLAQLRRILRQQAAQIGTSAHGAHHIPFDHHKS